MPADTTETKHGSTVFLRGGTIVTYSRTSDSVEVLRDSSILIQNDRIISIGETPPPEILARAEVINMEGKIISPGFIDTHRHGWQTAYKTLGANTTLVEYFLRYGDLGKASKVFTAEDVYIGQLTSIYESLNAGVTSMLDHASHTWSKETSKAGLQASIDSGARVWWSYVVHDIGATFSIDDQFHNLEELAKDEGGLLKGSATEIGLAYDRFDSAPATEVERALKLAKDLDLSVITTHYVGAPYKASNSVELLDSYSALDTNIPIVFSHASGLTEADIELLRKHNHFISITPESEHHYGHDHDRSHTIQDQAALGVDTHFTFSSDIVLQARFWLQETRLRLYRKVLVDSRCPVNNPTSVNQAFILATRNGAMALRRDDLGIIEPGAKADLVVFNGDSPNMLGWKDPVAAIILHSNVGDIEHVMVDGKFKKKSGKLVVDWDSVKENFLPSAERIQRIWAETEWPVLGDEFGGIKLGKSQTANVLRGEGNGY
ncbi:amidohydrolase [Cadophora sp. MPI-SDFR-AT-0126]|nr:amidohydrolase [Leotiomycetes sp. MPI-SDFR-AT-0126]